MKKRKAQIEIESLIHKAYKAGVCDAEGNSVENDAGLPTAKPKSLSVSPALEAAGIAWSRKY